MSPDFKEGIIVKIRANIYSIVDSFKTCRVKTPTGLMQKFECLLLHPLVAESGCFPFKMFLIVMNETPD